MAQKRNVEDYRQGYPRLAAFLTLDRNFTVLKRFDYIHMRSLLEQQDVLAGLEESLNRCDDGDRIQLGLSSRRQDVNQDRRVLLEQIRTNLKIYDAAVQDYHAMLRLPPAHDRHKQSVTNWFLGNKPLVRSESRCYIECLDSADYIDLSASDQDAAGLEVLADVAVKTFPRLAKCFASSKPNTLDPHIFVFPPHFPGRVIKILLAFLITLWLVCPTILLYSASDYTTRAIIFAIFTFWTSFVVIFLTNATKYDLIIALITYTTLLGAFLAESPSTTS